jgi:hypothetical protein
MGRLRVTYKLGLAYPFLLYQQLPDAPVVVAIPGTGNTVRIDVPQTGSAWEDNERGVLSSLVLHVERECSDDEGRDTSIGNARRLSITYDAARVFWQFFETLRYVRSEGDKITPTGTFVPASLAGYPVAPAEEIQSNLLVRTCDTVWVYEGVEMTASPLGAIATIPITGYAWSQTASRLAKGEPVPPYVSFALDAVYFSEGDPVRSVIMACAAWETALRYYLANVASKRNPVYLAAANDKRLGIPDLYGRAKAARGGALFYESASSSGISEFMKEQRYYIQHLPEWRNKLLHRGDNTIPRGTVSYAACAVLNAIDWLFR